MGEKPSKPHRVRFPSESEQTGTESPARRSRSQRLPRMSNWPLSRQEHYRVAYHKASTPAERHGIVAAARKEAETYKDPNPTRKTS